MENHDDSPLYRIRHSMAHVLAQAVKELYPEAQLGFGPPTDNGCFYDFDLGTRTIHESDLKEIETRMRKIIGQKQIFQAETVSFTEAKDRLEKVNETYKVENVVNLQNRGVTEFKFYSNGPFADLCEGPHVPTTGSLPAKAFKLDRIAGAYWLGDEKRKMLTRIYALVFETPEALQDYLKRRDLAAQFDHKKLGRELDIFEIDDLVGKGLPLWLPNGTIIRDEIEKYAKEVEFHYGYKRVATPHIAKGDLYVKSQHLASYKESMYPPMRIENTDTGRIDEYYLKPMNCPHHHLIYGARKRSYRDLPLRFAEYGTVYRLEQSGELSGLIRVRCLSMNDAHIYCRRQQLKAEMKNILAMYEEFYKAFKLTEFRMRLSRRAWDGDMSKFKGDQAMWKEAEDVLRDVLDNSGLEYFSAEGEAAFYGPKIDVQFRNLMGREETVSTIQVDFLSPKNFQLAYTDEEGKDQMPVIIHRSPLSTHERFISFLLEYYGGALPTWCAPQQVVLIPVNDDCKPYAQSLVDELHSQMVRIEIDDSDASFNKKIRNQAVRKVPIVGIIGQREVAEQTLTVKRYGVNEQLTLARQTFISDVLDEIRQRKNLRQPMGAML